MLMHAWAALLAFAAVSLVFFPPAVAVVTLLLGTVALIVAVGWPRMRGGTSVPGPS
jgi:hypothetical protein